MLPTLAIRSSHPAARTVSGEVPVPVQPELPASSGTFPRESRHFRPILVASRPGRMAVRRQFGGSVLTHLGMGALIILATRPASLEPANNADTTLFFLPRLQAATPAAEVRIPEIRRIEPAANPPPKGFQTIVAPTLVPTEIPEANLDEAALDPRDYTGVGVEGGAANGVVGGTGEFDPTVGPADALYDEETTDARYTRARIIHQLAPVYPPVLRQARIEGAVLVSFVIDTLGQVEPGSIAVLQSSRPTFDQPAIKAILGSRFAPARLGTTGVRQLTRQQISFLIR